MVILSSHLLTCFLPPCLFFRSFFFHQSTSPQIMLNMHTHTHTHRHRGIQDPQVICKSIAHYQKKEIPSNSFLFPLCSVQFLNRALQNYQHTYAARTCLIHKYALVLCFVGNSRTSRETRAARDERTSGECACVCQTKRAIDLRPQI